MTPKQRECLQFISDFWQSWGVCPSFDEIRVGLGLASKSGVYRLTQGLLSKGYLRRLSERGTAYRNFAMTFDGARALKGDASLEVSHYADRLRRAGFTQAALFLEQNP